MRLRNLVLAACAAFGLAMPAQAQVTFEWHLVGINSGNTQAQAQTNAALTANFFQTTPLVQGDVVTLQLMVRDNNPMGLSFNWGFGNGLYPPGDPFNGVGFSSVVGRVQTSNPAALSLNSPVPTNQRFVPPIDNPAPGVSELRGPNAGNPTANYPLPADDFSGNGYRPFAGLESFSNSSSAGVQFDGLAGISSGNPWENGDFPRLRPGTTSYLMPVVNLRFTASGVGNSVLQLVDPNPGTNDNQVSGLGGAAEPGGLLDGQLFGSYIPLNITVVPVPEPTSMALVGMAIAGIGYRKLRRKTTKEVVA